MSGQKIYHLNIGREQLEGAQIALIPGDPDRVAKIATHLSESRPLGRHREYFSHIGKVNGKSVVVCSTGIGGPSTAICVEELAMLGVKTFVRIGTTGAIQPHIPIGSVVVTQASVRLDGTSGHYLPSEFPAVGDFGVTQALVNASNELGFPPFVGITASSDTFYPGQERYERVASHLLPQWIGSAERWKRFGVLNYEMESASLFAVCTALGVKAGCVLSVIANRTKSEHVKRDAVEETEAKAIHVAVRAVAALVNQ
ncbi:MAG: uridine phosphorylase [Oligoflexales bacterium]